MYAHASPFTFLPPFFRQPQKKTPIQVVEALAAANITTFTAIQQATFDPLMDGRDMIGACACFDLLSTFTFVGGHGHVCVRVGRARGIGTPLPLAWRLHSLCYVCMYVCVYASTRRH